MDENRKYNTPEEEAEGIDILAFIRRLWTSRKTIFIVTGIFFALGLFSALTMTRTYSVSSTLVPQIPSRTNTYLSSLALLSGMDMGLANTGQDLSPLIYPQIVSSVPFRLELMNTPLHYEQVDTMVSMYTYSKEYAKPSVRSTVIKYTIGLPFTLINLLKKDDAEADDTSVVVGTTVEDGICKPISLTKEEAGMLKTIGSNVSLTVDKKEGYFTLTVTGSEPLQTAELAIKAQQLLQAEVTRFRTEKAKDNLKYVQARFNEIKAETESLQAQVATIRDRSQEMPTTRARIEQERLQNKYAVSAAIYTEMAKQLEQAKMQVKRETPMLTVVQPVTVPLQPSNSRSKTLIIWTFLGLILGCGIVLAAQVRDMLKGSPDNQ